MTHEQTVKALSESASVYLHTGSPAERAARIAAVRYILNTFQISRVSEARPEHVEVLQALFGPAREAQAGPAFSMKRADDLARMAGLGHDKATRFLEMAADENGDLKAMTAKWKTLYGEINNKDLPPLGISADDMQRARTEARMAAQRELFRLVNADKELSEDEAVVAGRFWTVIGAAKTDPEDRTNIMAKIAILRRRVTDSEMVGFSAVHKDAFVFADTTHIGTKQEAIAAAVKLLNCDEYAIRVFP